MTSRLSPPPGWRDAAEEPGHPLSTLDGVEVGQGVRLKLQIGAPGKAAAIPFRGFLESGELGLTLVPILVGRHHAGPSPALNWVEVSDFAGRVAVTGGEVEVPEGVDIQVVQALADLVTPGGHLLMEYGSEHRRVTLRALLQGVPPAATPLGGMMFAAGCGVAFTDLRVAHSHSGDGRRALQGYRAIDTEHEARRAPAMLKDLERFMDSSAELDWDLQLKCRPLAEAAITVLRSRLGVLARTFDLS